MLPSRAYGVVPKLREVGKCTENFITIQLLPPNFFQAIWGLAHNRVYMRIVAIWIAT